MLFVVCWLPFPGCCVKRGGRCALAVVCCLLRAVLVLVVVRCVLCVVCDDAD